MSNPQSVQIQIKPPSGSFPGQTAEGCFIVEDDLVTLTDREGVPARDGEGRTYSQKLKPGEHPKTIAGRLTRELRTALRGKDAPVRGFDGPITYPKSYAV